MCTVDFDMLNWQAVCLVDFLELRKEGARTLFELQRSVVYRDFSFTDTTSNNLHYLQMDVFVNDDGRHLNFAVTT